MDSVAVPQPPGFGQGKTAMSILMPARDRAVCQKA
jgi:hypothetical protein